MSFKVRLLLGAAAPLVLVLPATAQVQISTATTAPVATGTASSGAPANVEITAAGSITLPTAAGSTAFTINSNNTLTQNGAIAINNSDTSVGVRILPNLTTGYVGTGTITLLEDYTRSDADNDGDLDGAFASGTNRFGILVEPGGTLNGSINIGSGGATIEGNNSSAVSVQSILNGTYRQKGSLLVTGSNGFGLDLREDVTGDVLIGGSTTVQGEGSRGARILGDVAGEFLVDGSITATGFTSTSVSNYRDPDLLQPGDKTTAQILDADDLLVGGSALEIRGDLTRGMLVNGQAPGVTDPTTDVKDVIQNFNENRTTGSITSLGSAPAVLIQSLDGAAGDTLRLGLVRETVRDTLDDDKDTIFDEAIATFNYNFGLINRGTITGNGFNSGVTGTGLRIAGSADGLHQTVVDGGILNNGGISSTAFENDAIALSIGSGATTPQLVNTGTISSSVATETTHDAYGLRIDAGANLPSLTNSGLIVATARGYDGDAVAVRDLSGTLRTVTNSSRIGAGYSDDDTTDTITSGLGKAIALDLTSAGGAVTITQSDAADNARIFGNVLTGASSDRFDILSGEVRGDIDFGSAGADVLNISSANVLGNTAFHGASAVVSLASANLFGGVALGSAASTLSVTGGSTFDGGITGTGTVSMLVNNSTLNNRADGTLNVSTMNLQNGAKIGFVIDNARVAANTPIYNIGTANIAANTVFTPIFEEFTNQTFTLRVLNAATLNLGGPVAPMLNAQSPYMFDVKLLQPNANALDLSFRVKTATELGLNTRQAGAYAAVLDLMEEDSTIGAAVTSIPGADEFLRSWSDLLPAPDAPIMQTLASNATAAFGATAHRLDLISDKPDAPGGAWAEEFGVYHDSDTTADALGVSGGGFGVATGIDLLSTGSALVGAFASLESLELEEKGRAKAPLKVSQTTVGLYGGWRAGGLALNGAAGVGFATFASDRTVTVGTVIDRLKGDWKGQTYNVGARASYTQPIGPFELKPYISADYMGFKQDSYQENAATLADLEIIASDADATLATGAYGISLAGNFGSDDAFQFRPELSVGYRNVLTWDSTPAALRFAGGSTGTTFNINPGSEPEDAVVAGLGLNIDTQFLNIKLGYDTEISDTQTNHYGSITLRMAFW